MTDESQELAVAEAQLMIAACDYVDAIQRPDPVDRRIQRRDDLEAAVAAYRAVLHRPPVLPADHPLVTQGMRVVRRLLDR